MTMAKKKGDDDGGDVKKPRKKGGGGKLSRSETVTVRLDPKLRFAAELAARKHRRTLSSFIEWTVSEGVGRVAVGFNPNETAEIVASRVWDIDEADRFVKLASSFPHLLTHDEEILWKLICEKQNLWMFSDDKKTKFRVEKNPDRINLIPLRNVLGDFRRYIDGELSKEEMLDFDRNISAVSSSLEQIKNRKK